MSDRAPTSGSHDDEPSGPPAEAREASLVQELLRLQERHREGGIDPEPAFDGPDGPGTLPSD